MSETLTVRQARTLQLGRVAVQTLKACPLCQAINARANAECFSCSWAGLFEHDPQIVQRGLDELVRRCPELERALAPTGSDLVGRVWLRVRRLFRLRRLDIHV